MVARPVPQGDDAAALSSFPEATYYKAEFSKISLTGSTVRSRDFDECTFSGCSFLDTTFNRCRFLSCTFTDCVLSALVPMDSRISGVQFKKCKVIGADWTKAKKIETVSFDACQVSYSNFRFLKLPGVKMTGCEAKEADFTEADVHGADFSRTDFAGSTFFKTDLSGANFEGATNYAIDVTNNRIAKAVFSLPEAVALLKSLGIVIK